MRKLLPLDLQGRKEINDHGFHGTGLGKQYWHWLMGPLRCIESITGMMCRRALESEIAQRRLYWSLSFTWNNVFAIDTTLHWH
jgi:hypothetical protein